MNNFQRQETYKLIVNETKFKENKISIEKILKSIVELKQIIHKGDTLHI